MKLELAHRSHLVLDKVTLSPGIEWAPRSSGWSFIQLSAGVGYWLHPRTTQELQTGTTLVLTQAAPGYIRASQLGDLQLNVFRVEPERLTELVTIGEQRFLRSALREEGFSYRILPPSNPISESFRALCADTLVGHFCARLQMLQIFSEFFGNELKQPREQPAPLHGAKLRLDELLKQTPAAHLLELSLSELVETTHCTPRHLSRVFHEVMGMSFREKKAQLRLGRARELLATTDWKVSDVAFESGYPSVGVLNLVFKQRFGLTPRKWREQIRTGNANGNSSQSIPGSKRPSPQRALPILT